MRSSRNEIRNASFGQMARIWISFFLIQIICGFSDWETKANVSSGDASVQARHYVYQGGLMPSDKILGVSQEHPGLPARALPFTPEKQGDPWKENCYYKESFRNYADRGHDSFLFYAAGSIFVCPALPDPGFQYSQFIPLSSWSGDTWKIRPPPLD